MRDQVVAAPRPSAEIRKAAWGVRAEIGLALRKYIYRQRGALACDAIRSPGMRIDPVTARELEAMVERVGLSITAKGALAIE